MTSCIVVSRADTAIGEHKWEIRQILATAEGIQWQFV
jgi:hypothetical protein